MLTLVSQKNQGNQLTIIFQRPRNQNKIIYSCYLLITRGILTWHEWNKSHNSDKMCLAFETAPCALDEIKMTNQSDDTFHIMWTFMKSIHNSNIEKHPKIFRRLFNHSLDDQTKFIHVWNGFECIHILLGHLWGNWIISDTFPTYLKIIWWSRNIVQLFFNIAKVKGRWFFNVYK